MGIRLLAVSNDTFSPLPCRYQVRRESAIKTLLENWKSQNADGVTLVQSKDQRSATIDETLHTILDELEIPWSVATYKTQRSDTFLRELQRKKTGGIIF